MARAFVSSSFDFWQHVQKKEVVAVALQQKAPQMTDSALEEEEKAAHGAAVVLRLAGNFTEAGGKSQPLSERLPKVTSTT